MNKLYKSLLFVTSALSVVVITPAMADTPTTGAKAADDSVEQVEQITVTARRTTERLQDVPISIAVFSQQELSNHNVTNAADLAAYTPSLSANVDFGSQNASFAIRGFTQDIGTEPTVGVIFADVVAPRGLSQGQQAGDGAGPGDFFDLQNVQVLKGPQGTLFGINTTGGDILLVPNKPAYEFGGYVEASAGNYGMTGVQGVINIPVNDHIRLRFGIDHEKRDGYVNNTSGNGPSHFDGENYLALRASADIDVTPNLENYTIATYSNSDTSGDFQKLIACDPNAGSLFVSPLLNACSQTTPHAVTPLDPTPYQGGKFYDAAQGDSSAYSRLTEWRVINTTTWNYSDNLTIKNIASYAGYKDTLATPLFGTNFYTPNLQAAYGPTFPPAYSVGFANVTPLPGGASADSATYTEELQFQGHNWGDRLTWQAGLYLEGTDPIGYVGAQSPVLANCTNSAKLQCTDPVGYLLFLSGAVPFGTPVGAVNYTSGRNSYNDYAAYSQATYKLTDEFKVTGGIRYTQDRQTNTSSQISYHFGYPGAPIVATPTCTFPGTALPDCTRHFVQRSDAPTWLVDLDYTPTDDILAYAKYSRGYRAGVIVQNIVPPFNSVGPEKVDNYEAGLKTTFDGMLKGTFDIDGFYNNFANQQLLLGFNANPCYQMIAATCVPAPVAATAAPVNAGTSHIFGAELDAVIIPFDGLTLEAHYTYLHTELVDVKTFSLPANSLYLISGSQKAGDELPLSPHNKVSLSASYRLPVDEDVGNITLGATFTHTDRQLTNYADRSNPNPAFSGLSYVQATDLLDLNVNWDNIAQKPIDLSIFATNVTGQKYYTYIPGIGAAPAAGGIGIETANLGQPTMYGVRLRVDFGSN